MQSNSVSHWFYLFEVRNGYKLRCVAYSTRKTLVGGPRKTEWRIKQIKANEFSASAMWNENEMELVRMRVWSFWMCVWISSKLPYGCMHARIALSIKCCAVCIAYYNTPKHVDENNAILSIYTKHCTIRWRHALAMRVCVRLCMWILFKCTFPLMLNAPWHWFIRFAVYSFVAEWQTISVSNSHTHTRSHTHSFAGFHKMH